ncbi:MAG: hypothetical protein IPJ41_06780 [Phycisphaerales bacterium]|nr:hypothetical protein [Phycisphaerales bacterium]
MSRNTITLALLALAGSTAPGLAQIVNGSFETGLAYPTGPNIFAAGTPSPWVATTFTPDLYDNTGVDGWGIGGIPAYDSMFKGMAACQGDRFIGFAASVAFGGLNESFAQTTAPLNAGRTYTVSACMAVDDLGKAIPYGGPFSGRGEVGIYLNSSLIGTFSQNTASLTWEGRSISFVAPSSGPATLEFVAQLDPNNSNASYIGLDDIQMVPAPAATSLLGLAGLAAARRRRHT